MTRRRAIVITLMFAAVVIAAALEVRPVALARPARATFPRLSLAIPPTTAATTTTTEVAPRRVVTTTAVPASSPTTSTASTVQTGAAVASSDQTDVWDCIAKYESAGDWSIDTENGYSGGLQIANSEWTEYSGLPGIAADYPASTQIAAAEKLQAAQGWGAWPNTAQRCGV